MQNIQEQEYQTDQTLLKVHSEKLNIFQLYLFLIHDQPKVQIFY